MENKNKRSNSQYQIDGAVIPPHDANLEQAVLGALMIEGNMYFEVAGIISSEVFYDERNATIFSAIAKLAAQSRPIDLLTVWSSLKELNNTNTTPDRVYLVQLSQAVGSAAHIIYHAQLLKQFWVMRTMGAKLAALSSICYSSEFDQVTSEYQTTLTSIDAMFAGSGCEKHISQILMRHGDLINERIKRANKNEIQGLTYGLDKLDRMTGGMQPGQLIILAARPAMGKTAVALKFAKSAALISGAAVTIASLEMTDLSLTDRLLSSYSGIDSSHLKSGRMTTQDIRAYERAVGELSKLNISIDDTAGTTLGRLTAMARTKHRKGELDLLIIDYLQLIESDKDSRDFKRNREQEVAMTTRGLKKLAKDLSIPVVLLCQLNRSAETRADKQPQLYDLRESGGIEQDADVVMMPFRPSYYKELRFTDEHDVQYPEDKGFIFIRKQREGSVGEVAFRHSADLSSITDYDSDYNNISADNGLF